MITHLTQEIITRASRGFPFPEDTPLEAEHVATLLISKGIEVSLAHKHDSRPPLIDKGLPLPNGKSLIEHVSLYPEFQKILKNPDVWASLQSLNGLTRCWQLVFRSDAFEGLKIALENQIKPLPWDEISSLAHYHNSIKCMSVMMERFHSSPSSFVDQSQTPVSLQAVMNDVLACHNWTLNKRAVELGLVQDPLLQLRMIESLVTDERVPWAEKHVYLQQWKELGWNLNAHVNGQLGPRHILLEYFDPPIELSDMEKLVNWGVDLDTPLVGDVHNAQSIREAVVARTQVRPPLARTIVLYDAVASRIGLSTKVAENRQAHHPSVGKKKI